MHTRTHTTPHHRRETFKQNNLDSHNKLHMKVSFHKKFKNTCREARLRIAHLQDTRSFDESVVRPGLRTRRRTRRTSRRRLLRAAGHAARPHRARRRASPRPAPLSSPTLRSLSQYNKNKCDVISGSPQRHHRVRRSESKRQTRQHSPLADAELKMESASSSSNSPETHKTLVD